MNILKVNLKYGLHLEKRCRQGGWGGGGGWVGGVVE